MTENDVYKRAVDQLLDFHATVKGEWGAHIQEPLDTAQELYEEHGPFELDPEGEHGFQRYELPEWYE